MKIYVYLMVLIALAYYPLHRGAGDALRRQLGMIPFVSIAIILLVGTVTPWPAIFLLVVATIPLVQPGNRMDVACRYLLLVPLMPAATPTFSLGSHYIGQFNALEMLNIGALGASLIASQRPSQPRPHGLAAEDYTLLVMLVIFGVASPRFDNASALLRNLLVYTIDLGIPFWIIRRNVRTWDELILALACFGAGVALITPIAVYEHHVGWALLDPLTRHLAPGDFLSHSSSVRGGALRSAATLATPIELGMMMMLGLFAIYCARRHYRSRAIWLGTLGMLLLAMLCAQSRGAVLSTGVGIVVLLAWQRRWAHLASTVVAAFIGYAVLRVNRGSFLATDTHFGQYRDYRTLLLDRGLEEGWKHPFFGLSLDDVQRSLVDLVQGEQIIDFVNTYLNVFLVSGLVGLGLLLVSLACVFVGLLRPASTARRDVTAERGRIFCLMGLTALSVSLVTTSFYGRVPFMLGLLLGVARMLRATSAKAARPRDVPVLQEVGAMPRVAA